MDFVSFIKDAVVGGVPLIFVVIGLVEWLKKFGVSGNALTASSMLIGLVLGSAYMISQQQPPIGSWWDVFNYLFLVVVYGLSMGIIASGLYDTVKGIIESAISKK